ncbi:hypothetical protein GGX14DRAFT_359943, partial [Mycena pura]
RFRKVPTFGRYTIRKFHANVSELKRLGGRDFEDILQCILPVVEGLAPPEYEIYEPIIMEMWFVMCTWHGLAKLRLHNTTTLELFRKATTDLGDVIRRFEQQTREVKTFELPKEQRARDRRKPKKTAVDPVTAATATMAAVKTVLLQKKLNIETPKAHALGYYVSMIQDTNTADSCSTQNVSCLCLSSSYSDII